MAAYGRTRLTTDDESNASSLQDQRSDGDLLSDRSSPADSYAAFYRRHVDAVIRYAASRGLRAEEAADVVSETFLSALAGRHSYRPQRESARFWLLAIASRRIADLHRASNASLRREAKLRTEAIVLTQGDRESYAALLELEADPAADLLAELPSLQQRALRARVLDDREYADIADSLGLSQAATRQHVSRGLSRLRKALKRTS